MRVVHWLRVKIEGRKKILPFAFLCVKTCWEEGCPKSVALMVPCDGGSWAEMGQESSKGDSSLCTYLYSKCSNYKNVLNLNYLIEKLNNLY